MKESVYLKLMELLEAEEKKKPLDRDEVMSRIHAGETVEEIAAKEGVSPKFVKMLYDRATKAKSSALTRRTIREPKAEIEDQARALPIPKLARIAKDILNGMHPSDIAQAHGIEFQLASGMSKIMN